MANLEGSDYHFGEFTLDRANFRLLKGDQELSLPPRAFDLLVYLIDNRDRVVEKQELFERVWNESFVTDNALTRVVKEIRHELNDDAASPKYIQTIHKRGYRFIGLIAEKTLPTKSDDEISVRTKGEPAKLVVRSRRNYAIAAGAVVCALVLAFAAFYFGRDESQLRALVVLPLENSTGNPEDEYLSEGITESLLNSLSQIPGIKVISRTTAFRYKGKEVDPQQLRRDLGVDAVVTGRVIRQGDNLIVQAELTNTATGSQVWGDRFSRKKSDIFLLQDEIAKIISQELKLKLSGDEAKRLTKRYTENPAAYEFYLRGRHHLAKLTPSEVQASVGYFQQAIAADASYALAYVGLADAYSALALSVDMPANEVYPKAKAAARTALDIDESLAEAHTSLGFAIQFYDWDFRSAENQYKRALELNPNSSDAHFGYASLFALMAKWDDALSEIERARALDPLNLRINTLEGRFLVLAGRVDEGLAKLHRTIELEPNYFLAHLFASNAYLEKGMYQEAIDEATKAKNLSDGNAEAIAWIAYSLAKWGKPDEARAVLEELKKSAAQRYVPPYNFAVIYEGLNESEATLEWLERGVAQRDPKMLFLRNGLLWKKWHNDTRFNSLLERINQPNN